MRVICAEGLSKSYGETLAVNGVSFEVEAGEVFGLLGRNGAGKTTVVECVQGLRQPDAGSALVLGLDPSVQRAELRWCIGSQLQDSALPDRLRVWEVLDLFASFGRQAARPDWRTLLCEWGLAGKERAHFDDLSGGQRQRLFVALALVNDPRIVFLDKMTAGLDPAARRVAWDLVDAVSDRGITVVLVTHFAVQHRPARHLMAARRAGCRHRRARRDAGRGHRKGSRPGFDGSSNLRGNDTVVVL